MNWKFGPPEEALCLYRPDRPFYIESSGFPPRVVTKVFGVNPTNAVIPKRPTRFHSGVGGLKYTFHPWPSPFSPWQRWHSAWYVPAGGMTGGGVYFAYLFFAISAALTVFFFVRSRKAVPCASEHAPTNGGMAA